MRTDWKKIIMPVVIVAVAATVWIAYWWGTHEPRTSISCIGHLRAISAATFHWITINDHRTPPSLESLLDHPGVSRKTFICPAAASKPDEGVLVCDYDSMFDRAGRAVSYTSIDETSRTMMVWDREAVHGRGEPYRYALFADGSVRPVYEAEFEAALKRLGGSASPRRKQSEGRPPGD